MTRAQTTQSTFAAGEWSPLMLGRTDLPRYQQCCSELENALVLIQGGATRRWGTRYIAPARYPTKAVRLMPWRFSVAQSYVLELGDLYARFYTQVSRIEDPPGTPVQVVTPWTEAQLPDLEWVQYGDTAIMVHPDVVPYRIVRISSTQWKVQAAPFIVFPSAEWGLQPATNITLSAASGAITITSGAAAFLASDVGRQVIGDIGEATITGFTSTTQVNASVPAANAFQSLAYASGAWTITESPKTTLTLTALTNKRNGAATLTLGAAGWRAGDVGSYVFCEDGQIEITGFTSTTIVSGRVRELLKTGTAAGDVVESAAWSLEPKTWNATRGYPRAVALHEQRLMFGGTVTEPVSVWASVTGIIYDMSRGVRDAAGFAQTFFAHDMSPIMHAVSAPTSLLVLTGSAEMTAGTGSDDAMTPTNIRPRTGALNGASSARPVFVNNDLVYVQDGGTKIRALAWQQQENALWSPDLSWEAEHLLQAGVTEICYTKRPHPQLSGIRSDGVLVTCGMYRQTGILEHDVLGWARQTTQGDFISCATIPYGTEDQLWLAVQRQVGGSTVTMIELADYTLHTDCAVTGTGAASSSWSGFDHLEGLELVVLGDQREMNPSTVTGGLVATDRDVTRIEAGLRFDSALTLPDIEPTGASFGASKLRVNEIFVDLYDTIGLEIQSNDQRWFQFGPAVLDQPPPAVTGKRSAPNMGWDTGIVRLRQIHPYKWTVRRVVRRYTVNEG